VIVLVLDDKTIKRIFYVPLIAMRRKDMAWDFFYSRRLEIAFAGLPLFVSLSWMM